MTRSITVTRGATRTRSTAIMDQRVDATRAKDPVDHAIEDSLENGEPIHMDDAFPELPDPGDDPAGRMKAVGTSGNHGGSYLREYRLRLLHRLLMRNLPADLIMQQLQIGQYTFHDLRRELNRRLKKEAQNIDHYAMFGRTMAFYDEIRGTALRMATDIKMPAGSRVGALTVALAAEGNKHNFLDRAGFFQHNRFAPPKAEKIDSVERGRSELGMLLTMSAKTMAGDEDVTYLMDEPDEDDGDDADISLLT